MKIASPRRSFLTRWITLACVVMFAAPTLAAEPAAPSLKLVPQDASFYLSTLRLREQFETVANSNWWAKIEQSEEYQQAMMLWEFTKMDPESPVVQFEEWLDDPANKQLSEVVLNMVSDEVFIYGGKGFAESIEVLQTVSNATNQANYARQAKILAGSSEDIDAIMEDSAFAMRAMLLSLTEQLDKLKTPEFVIGFRLEDTKPAEEQLKRLEAFATVMLEMVPEAAPLRGKMKRQEVAGSEFLTLTLDGKMIPWDQLPMPLEEIAEEPGQFDALKKHIEGQELIVSLGIHKGYVLLSVGSSLDHLKKLGSGPVLADAARLAPLRALGDKRFTSVTFASESLMKSISFGERDLNNLAAMATAMMPMAEITEEFKAALLADIPELKKDLEPLLPQPGDVLSFTYLNGRGYELYTYDWGSNRLIDSSQPLAILEHLGGKPILAIAGRGANRPQDYELLVKWFKKAKQHFETHVVDTMPEGDKEAYKQIAAVAYPALKKADKINRDLLLPALADGQVAIVIDGVSTSEQWYMDFPVFDRAMPMPMPAVVLGLTDADKFTQALGEYKSLAAETLLKLSELAPEEVPPVQIPDPKQETPADGLTLYSYPLPPPLGFDAKAAPNMGVGENFAVFSLLPEQTERLATAQPLISGSAPLMDPSRPLGAAAYFDFHALLDTARPWIEEGVTLSMQSMFEMQAQFEEEEGEDFDDSVAEEAIKSALDKVDFWMNIAGAFHGFSSALYTEDGATVTHAEFHFEDVE